MFALVVLGLVSSVLAQRLAGKNVSEMTYLFYVKGEISRTVVAGAGLWFKQSRQPVLIINPAL